MHGFSCVAGFVHIVGHFYVEGVFVAERVFRAVLVAGLEGVSCVVHVQSAEGVWRAKCVLSTFGGGGCVVW